MIVKSEPGAKTVSGDFKTIIFDFDGTLADTFSFAVAGLNHLSQKYNYRPIAPQEIPRLRHLTAKEIIKVIGLKPFWVPFVYREGLRLLNKEIRNVSLVAQPLGEILKQLRFELGVRLGIVTSNTTENVRAFLDAQRLAVFDFVFSCSSLWGKHRAIVKAMRHAGLKTGETLYVGDEIRDIEAARDAGIAVAAVGWGYNAEEALRASSPDYLCHSPSDLLTVVKPVP